ncbi:Protein FAM72A [Nosema granulosis]|uniref:Protein FAM72A n=1 Tax=Nosema granulosis TaxID=83296 RepID=A0A9P6H112_9MICR|nr:Protein FAM72A [Nosema granulosis]
MKGFKFVYSISCRNCCSILSRKAMKSVLLTNTSIRLFSSNNPTPNVRALHSTYVTRSCECMISNIKCTACNSLVGYTIVSPCELCLRDKNNGHHWMFDLTAISSCIRIQGLNVLRWISDARIDEESELRIR